MSLQAFEPTILQRPKPTIGLRVLAISALLISDDVFLVLPVGGSYHLRAVQFLLGFGTLAILLSLLFRPIRTLSWPPAFGALSAWVFTLSLFAWNVQPSGLMRNVGYQVWLFFDVLIVFATRNAVRTLCDFQTLLKWYFAGMWFAAAIGVLQVLLPPLGIIPPFIAQWWVEGVWARANGISYEPSYFATFLIAGWVSMDYFRMKRAQVFSKKVDMLIYVTVTVAMIVSTSRMGWMAMLAWVGLRATWTVFGIRRGVNYARLAVTALVIVLVVLLLTGTSKLSSTLLAGTGANDEVGGFSAEARSELFWATVKVAKENPWFGVSLGGVATEIAHDWHVDRETGDPGGAKLEGMSVFAEALAASGAIGFMFVAVYFIRLIVQPLRTRVDSDTANIVKGLAWGLVAQLALLQTNENVLRQYLWFHIALLSAGFALVKAGEMQYKSGPQVRFSEGS